MGPSGASFPLCKKQKTVLSEAEVIGEQQLFEPFVPYGQPDGSKAGLKVPRDSITSSDYISQAIGDDASPIVIERSLKNRAIKDKSKADLESYVEKYHTRVSEYMNVDIEQLVLSMAEAILNPNADTTSDKVLEYAIDMEHAIDMAEVPALDKCNLFQVVGDMLKDAVMKLTITLKKLETKHAQWMASLTNEQASSRPGKSNTLPPGIDQRRGNWRIQPAALCDRAIAEGGRRIETQGRHTGIPPCSDR